VRFCQTLMIAALALAGCSTAAGTRSNAAAAETTLSPATTLQEPTMASAMQFLLASAAADFHAHPPVAAIRFHGVRIGHLMTAEGARQYLLCGEFSSARDSSHRGPTPFATIKTSGYEQSLGAQAKAMCQRDSLTWDSDDDLSPLLQHQFDATR